MAKIANIAKNTSYLTIALILQKVISFTYFTLLARYVGPASLGQYYLAISFTTIFAIFIDLGFSNVLTREIAKDQSRAGRWLASVLAVKLPLSFLAAIATILAINLLGYDGLTRSLVYISLVSMVLDSFTATFFSVVRGFHNLKYESISSVVFQLIVLGAGYGALLAGGGLRLAMAALALASLFNFIYSAVVVRHRLKIALRLIYDWPLIKEIIMISWPFAAYAILQRVYTYIDSVLLSILAGDTQVGLYQVAFKIIFALQFLPLAFTASLYPALSSYWQSNREQLAVSFERALNYLAIISLPIIVGAIVLSDRIVLLFTSDYSQAVWPLRISILSLFFIFLNFPIGSLLNACDAQRRNTANMAVVAVVSVVLNLLLIPFWQATGASLTVLVTNFLMFILGLVAVRRIITYRAKRNFVVVVKALTAAILMGAAVYLGGSYLNIVAVTVMGAIIYFASLLALGGFKKEDVLSIARSFSRGQINKNIETEIKSEL